MTSHVDPLFWRIVAVTVNFPALAYLWLGVVVVLLLPSPNFHATLVTPLEEVAVKPIISSTQAKSPDCIVHCADVIL